MNLFFDTECANCNNHIAKICEFGYVLTDDYLNIIDTQNLLINPNDKFNTYGFKKAGIKLSYKTSVYQSAPNLSQRYEKIKSLLTDKNTVVYGFSTQSDADYILTDLKRNNLPQINFSFYDVRALFECYLNRKEKLSLDSIYSEIEAERGDMVHHEARNDAFMTLACLKYFLKMVNKTAAEIKGNYPLARGELFEGRIIFGGVVFGYTRGNKITQNNRKILLSFIDTCTKKRSVKNIDGKIFCFERGYERTHFAEVLLATEKIIEGGGNITNLIHKSDYIVIPDGFKYNSGIGKRQKLIAISDLIEILSVDAEKFNENDIDIDLILSRMPENKKWFEKYKKCH